MFLRVLREAGAVFFVLAWLGVLSVVVGVLCFLAASLMVAPLLWLAGVEGVRGQSMELGRIAGWAGFVWHAVTGGWRAGSAMLAAWKRDARRPR